MAAMHGRLVSGGRLQVPAAFRQALGLVDGDPVVMDVQQGELRIRPLRDVVREIQAAFKPYAPTDGTLVSDQLIADRRAEAARE